MSTEDEENTRAALHKTLKNPHAYPSHGNAFWSQGYQAAQADIEALQAQVAAMRAVILEVYQFDDLPKYLEELVEPFVDPSDRYMRNDNESPMPGQEP